MPQRTPLFSAHQTLGARFVDFGGWEMPVQYSGIIDEHLAVRSSAGVFDISHMGEIAIEGPGAESFLNETLTNDVRRLAPGDAHYSILCRETGGVIDDLYVYRLGTDRFLLMVNASRTDDDYRWLSDRREASLHRDAVRLENLSNRLGAMAVQGPRVTEFMVQGLARVSGGARLGDVLGLKKNRCLSLPWERGPGLVARTGYTGEDGFEVIAPASLMETLWLAMLDAGRAVGIKPCGLGARDTLRTEMCYPLYGHELDERTTPIEAGLGYFVSLEKGDFVGRSVLAGQKAAGVTRRCAAFRMMERGAPPRPGYWVFACDADGPPIGTVASGTLSPSLQIGIGMVYVAPESAKPGTRIDVEIRGRRTRAEVVGKPIFRKPV